MDFKLSIIIPVLNDVEALKKLIPYLIKHINGHEIWVIESSFSKVRSNILCETLNIKYAVSPISGRAAQMNFGARMAEGSVYLFLHADVMPPVTFISNIEEKIKCGIEMGYFAYKFSPSNKWLDINASFTMKEGIFTGGGDQCHFFTKSTFKKLGGYDEKYVIMEDFALILKAKKFNIPSSIIQEKAVVSSRKYKNNPYLWVNFINLITFTAFYLGVSPIVLKKMYSRALS